MLHTTLAKFYPHYAYVKPIDRRLCVAPYETHEYTLFNPLFQSFNGAFLERIINDCIGDVDEKAFRDEKDCDEVIYEALFDFQCHAVALDIMPGDGEEVVETILLSADNMMRSITELLPCAMDEYVMSGLKLRFR